MQIETCGFEQGIFLCTTKKQFQLFLQDPDKLNTLARTDYSQLVPPLPCTRNQTGLLWLCTVCVLARTKFPYQSKALLAKFVSSSSSQAVSSSTSQAVSSSSSQAVRKQCQLCYSYIGRGLHHFCTKASKRANLEKIVKNSSRKTKARVTSNIVKNIFEERSVDKRGGTVDLETGGKPLSVTLGCKTKPRRFDVASMMKLQTVCHLSDKTVL